MKDMLGRNKAFTVDEAIMLMLKNITLPEKVEDVLIDDAYGRVLSRDIVSPEDLPGFVRSTVDGFAVIASDTFGATESMPVYLTVRGEVLMGQETTIRLNKGEAVRIATGGMLPHGSNAVVMLEHTQYVGSSLIEVLRPVAPKENVISHDEDIKKGEVMLEKGKRLRPQDVAAVAGIGLTRISVYKKPVVSIISTGDEIVPAESPVMPGKVRDINSYNLAGLIAQAGGIPVKKGIFKDIYEDLRDIIKASLLDSDMVIITGGSSVGTRDLTAKVINSLGRPGVLFHGVNLKPGKPTLGAVLDGIPVLGLPGHPAAVTVCFELFAEQLITILSGEQQGILPKRTTVRAKLTKNISSAQGRQEHIRVKLVKKDEQFLATPILGKSGLIRTLVHADGEIIIPSHLRGIEAGEDVEVVLFHLS